MAPEVAMLNVRMARDVRERGNATLAEFNITPSEFVRAMWTKLTGDKRQVEKHIASVISAEHTDDRPSEIKRRRAAIEHAPQIFYDLANRLELDPTTHVPMTDDELKDARYDLVHRNEEVVDDQ